MRKLFSFSFLVLSLGVGLFAQQPINRSIVSYANESVTGTTINKLVKLTGAPSAAVLASTSDTSGIVGLCAGGCGATGTATIQYTGVASCVFTGATTAGDYVQIDTTTAGNCKDAGSAFPTTGQVLGRVTSTNASGGTYSVDLTFQQKNVAAGGGGGGLSAPAANGPMKYTGSNTTAPATVNDISTLGYCSDAANTNAYACALSPAITSYVSGSVYSIAVTNSNTGSVTFNLNGLGAIPLKRRDGTALQAGDIAAGRIQSCRYDGASCQTEVSSAGSGSGLTAPAANGPMKYTGSNATAAANANDLSAPAYCSDAGSTGAYSCTLSPAIAAYSAGSRYWFRANTANSGAATLALNGLAAVTIKKVAGSITTDLAANDIRAGQLVGVIYDGTNFQMATPLGNTSGGSGSSSPIVLAWYPTANVAGSTTKYAGFTSFNTSQPAAAAIVPQDGTLSTLRGWNYIGTQGADGALTCTLQKATGIGIAFTDTALSIAWTSADAAGTVKTDTTNSVAVVAGDRLVIKCANASASASVNIGTIQVKLQ
jgi:hypothetical protein